jgi:hypothetical protein
MPSFWRMRVASMDSFHIHFIIQYDTAAFCSRVAVSLPNATIVQAKF